MSERMTAKEFRALTGQKQPKRAYTAKEDDEQAALFEWAEINLNIHPELEMLFAVPNGGYRNLIEAKRLKAQGVKRGVCDIFLDVPKGGYHGLRIELKVGKNTASKDQQDFIAKECGYGYYARVVWGWDAAREEIERYLRGVL